MFSIRANYLAGAEFVALFQKNLSLIWRLAKKEITDRYVGQFLGNFWVFFQPLVLMFVYTYIFTAVFQVRMAEAVPEPSYFAIYIMSGLIPWLTINENLSKSTYMITGNANLVKQVIFPVEVLPIKGAISSMLVEIIFLVFFMIYIIFTLARVPTMWAMIPVLLLIQIVGMIGTSLMLSALAVYFRDIKDIIYLVTTVLFYAMPILYLPAAIPASVETLIFWNPLSHMIWCFQDTFYFGTFEHPWSWMISALSALILLFVGYRFFRKFKVMFGNAL